jgi:type I restriction enzyme S subunit
MCETCNITDILLLPKGIFAHTNFDTCVIIMTKGSQTKEIKYHQGYFKDEDKGKGNKIMYIKENVLTLTFEMIVNKDWSLKYEDYTEKKDNSIDGIKYKPLGEVCEFKHGKAITTDKLINGEYNVIGGGLTLMDYTHNEYNTNENEIIMSNDGAYAGFLNKFYKKIFITSHCNKCIITDTNVNKDYLFLFLKISYQNRLISRNETGFQKGQAQPSININKMYKEIKIPILPTEHQQRIVDFMDSFIGKDYKQLDAVISKFKDYNLFELLINEDYDGFKQIFEYYDDIMILERIENQLKNEHRTNLIKGCFNSVDVDYVMKPLGDLCELDTGIKCSLVNYYVDDTDNGNYLIRINNLTNDNELIKFNEEYAIKYKHKQVNMNDILIGTVTNGYIQHKIVPEQWKGYNYNGAIIKLSNIKYCNVEYLYWALYFCEKNILKQSFGQAQHNLCKSRLEKIQIPVPSIEDQHKVVAMIEAIEKDESDFNNMLKGFKQSIKTIYKSVETIVKSNKILHNEEQKDDEYLEESEEDEPIMLTYKDKQYIVKDNIMYNSNNKKVGTWNDGKVKKC